MNGTLQRRSFLKSLVAVAATRHPLWAATSKPQKFLAGFAPATNGTLDSFWRNMEACSKVGFHTIEVDNSRLKLAEAYIDRINEFKDRMAKLNLRLVGLNQSYPLLDATKYPDIRKENLVIGRFLKSIGAIYAGPYGALSDDEEQMRSLARLMNEEGKRMREENGVRYSYHTHSSTGFRRLMDLTNPGGVYLNPDLGWLAARGSADAVEVCRAYRSRITTIHLKDFDPNYEFDYQGKHMKGGIVIPGKGVVNFPAVVEFLKESDFDGCLLGEHIGIGTYEYVREDGSVGAYPAFREYMANRLSLKL